MATETQQVVQREAPEIEAYKLGLLQSAKELADQRVGLPKQMVAGMSGLQDQAIKTASPQAGGIGGYQAYLDAARASMAGVPGMVTGAVTDAGQMYGQGASGVTGEQIQGYMNPYQQAVQDEINRSYDIQASQAGLGAAGAGAFGGSRAGIQQTEIDRNRASALAQAQAQNFMQAQQAAERERQRQLGAAQGIGALGLQGASALGQFGVQQAGIGELSQASALKDIQTQFGLGKQQQAQQQAELEAKRQSDLAQLYEPYQRLGFLSDIYKGAPTSQMTLSRASSPSVSPAQQFLGLGIAGLSAYGGAKQAGLF
jgi:hypothetical protein